MSTTSLDRSLRKWERWALWFFLFTVIVFGGIVEYRSAFLQHRRTDADDLFRAGWGIRAGKDIYELVDTQGWHYNYPPFFAILTVPFANPPPGTDNAGYLPYAVSIALWYVLSIVSLWFSVHLLASMLEDHFSGALAGRPSKYSARWWWLRMLPVLICMPAIGRTLSRGQVNLYVILLFCGIAIWTVRKRSVLAGACIGIAASVKLFPAYIGLFALIRRDWRCVLGCFVGAFVCLAVVPVVTLGPARTEFYYQKFANVTIMPALTGGGDRSRAHELVDAAGTDSQSFLVIIHNTLHPFPPRPQEAAPWVYKVHWTLSILITFVTVWFGRRSRPDDALYNTVLLGTVIVCMLPISPMSHTHYMVFALPLVMALIAYSWEKNQAPHLSRGYQILFGVHLLFNVVGLPEHAMILKALGFAFYGTFILWFAGLHALKERADTALPATGSHA